MIIHNPASGRQRSHRQVSTLAEELRRAGWDVELERTRYMGHATSLAAQAVASKFPMVIAAGGDGTVNEVVQALAGTETVLAVAPSGTVNVWAAEAALPSDPRRLVDLLTEGRIRRIDLGRAGARHFLLMASMGFDAAVVQSVDPALKRAIGRWAYLLRAAALSWRYTGSPLTVHLDGVPVKGTVLMLIIGNTRRYAGKIQIAPQARADDGQLDICIIRGDHVWQGLYQAGAVASGSPSLRRAVFTARARTITLQAQGALPLQLDGEYVGQAPETIEVVPGALQVLVGLGNAGGLFTNDE